MYDPFGPNEEDTDDSWIDSLTFEDLFAISEDTTELAEWARKATPSVSTGADVANVWGPDQTSSSDADIGGRTSGRGSASAGANGSGSDSGSGGIFDGLGKFVEDHKDAIGLGAGALAYWGKTISDNRNASQAADAAEMLRQQKEQERLDLKKEKQEAIDRSGTNSATDWEREKERIKLGQDFTTATNKQAQLDRLELAAFNKSSSGGGGGGGGGFDPAAARAARVSASIVGMKPTKTGIVNSNIWGNALNTLQRK